MLNINSYKWQNIAIVSRKYSLFSSTQMLAFYPKLNFTKKIATWIINEL